jgi:hypothetical protein
MPRMTNSVMYALDMELLPIEKMTPDLPPSIQPAEDELQ